MEEEGKADWQPPVRQKAARPSPAAAAPAAAAPTLASRARWLVAHPRFEQGMIACIVANCLLLACEDPTRAAQPAGARALDASLTVIFIAEAAVKLVAEGVRNYWSSAWNWLDAVVAAEGAVGLAADALGGGAGGASGLRALKALRVLRPLRALTRLSLIHI